MVYLGKSEEKEMFFGAKPKLFIYAKNMRKSSTEEEKLIWKELTKRLPFSGLLNISQADLRRIIDL